MNYQHLITLIQNELFQHVQKKCKNAALQAANYTDSVDSQLQLQYFLIFLNRYHHKRIHQPTNDLWHVFAESFILFTKLECKLQLPITNTLPTHKQHFLLAQAVATECSQYKNGSANPCQILLGRECPQKTKNCLRNAFMLNCKEVRSLCLSMSVFTCIRYAYSFITAILPYNPISFQRANLPV